MRRGNREGGRVKSRGNVSLVREFTSIFISTRRQLFNPGLRTKLPRAIRRICRRGVIKQGDRGTYRSVRGAEEGWEGETRERITYMWEKTGGFEVVEKRGPIIISRGDDAPFRLTARLRSKRC